LFSDHEEELTKQVFLIAGELKEDLEQVDQDVRNFYLAVTRIDGCLGLKNHQNFQEGSGLTGLAKTLKWEWPEVFCRAIDISPDLDPGKAAETILKEIKDPDIVLTEVGISEKGRVTIERGNQ
jgi:hypothetical protein